jgi:hypothetical protein
MEREEVSFLDNSREVNGVRALEEHLALTQSSNGAREKSQSAVRVLNRQSTTSHGLCIEKRDWVEEKQTNGKGQLQTRRALSLDRHSEK